MPPTITRMTDDQCLALAMVAERPRRHERLVADLGDDLVGLSGTARALDALMWLADNGLASPPTTELDVWRLSGSGLGMLGQVQSRVGGQ
jgi:hypothetical protein